MNNEPITLEVAGKELEFSVDYYHTAGYRGVFNKEPEYCYDGQAAEYDIVALSLDGVSVSHLIKYIEAEIIEQLIIVEDNK